MSNIILLEQEEDIRLAAVIVARNRGIVLKVYQDFKDYEKHLNPNDIIYSSNISDSKKYNLKYIQKPYTAHELISIIGGK